MRHIAISDLKAFILGVSMSGFLLIALLLVPFHVSFGQNSTYNFAHFTSEQGLPSKHIHQICQDESGYLWLATSNGLARFDGQYFMTYQGADFGRRLSSNVTAVLAIDEDTIWLVVDRKTLLSFSISEQSFSEVFDQISDSASTYLRDITKLKRVGSKIYAIGKSTFVFEADTLQYIIKYHTAVHDIEELSDNNIILAGFDLCQGKLNLVDTRDNYKIYRITRQKCYHKDLPSNHLLRDPKGQIWSAPWSNEVHCLTTSRQIKRHTLSPSPNSATSEVNTLAIGRQGEIWIGSNNNGLHMLDRDNASHHIVSENGPPQDCYITTIYSDNKDRVWIGTQSNGLYLLDPRMNQAENFDLGKDIEVLSIFTLSPRRHLVGTTHGLWLLDEYQGYTPIDQPKYASMKVFDIYKNYKGELLLGTDSALLLLDTIAMQIRAYKTIPLNLTYKEMDLNRLNNTRILHLQDYILDKTTTARRDSMGSQYLEGRLSDQDCTSYTEEGSSLRRSFYYNTSDTLLIGTIYGYGVFFLDYASGRFNHGPFNSTINNTSGIVETNRANKVYVDTQNGLWGLTEYSGAWLSKGVIFGDSSYFSTSTPDLLDYYPPLGINYAIQTMGGDPLRSNNFQDMIQLDDDRYLVITLEGELVEIWQSSKTAKLHFTHDQELHQIINLRGNEVYLKDEEGVVKYNLESGQVSSMGRGEGIKYSGSVGILDTFGNILLGGRGGISKINAQDLNPLPEIDKVIYSKEVKVMGKVIDQATNYLELDYDENFIEIALSHLDLSPSSYQYEYRIPQMHDNWIKTSDGLSYPGLKAGTYTLEARVVNEEISASKQIMSIRIHPPWWQTWWFIIAAIGGTLSLLYTLYRYQLNVEKTKGALQLDSEIKAQEAERKRLSNELHDDLGMRMSAIRMYVDAIANITDGKNQEVQDLSNKAVNLVDESMQGLRNLLNNLSPSTLRLNGLVAAVTNIAVDINSLANTKISFEHDYEKDLLNPDKELNVFRIIQELINNSLKHACCDTITIKLQCSGTHVVLDYMDDGIGFDSKLKHEGYGFKNIHTRAKSSNAQYSLTSKSGFKFTLKIPIDDPKIKNPTSR